MKTEQTPSSVVSSGLVRPLDENEVWRLLGDLWRQYPRWPSTFGQCSNKCGSGHAGRGGGPCRTCVEIELAKHIGEVGARAYHSAIQRVRALEGAMFREANERVQTSEPITMSTTTDPPELGCDALVRRWTPEQIENANRIVNDIAEDIDNSESRRSLRMSLAIYADLLSDERERRNRINSDEMLEHVKKVSAHLKTPNASDPAAASKKISK